METSRTGSALALSLLMSASWLGCGNDGGSAPTGPSTMAVDSGTEDGGPPSTPVAMDAGDAMAPTTNPSNCGGAMCGTSSVSFSIVLKKALTAKLSAASTTTRVSFASMIAISRRSSEGVADAVLLTMRGRLASSFAGADSSRCCASTRRRDRKSFRILADRLG